MNVSLCVDVFRQVLCAEKDFHIFFVLSQYDLRYTAVWMQQTLNQCHLFVDNVMVG